MAKKPKRKRVAQTTDRPLDNCPKIGYHVPRHEARQHEGDNLMNVINTNLTLDECSDLLARARQYEAEGVDPYVVLLIRKRVRLALTRM